MNILKKLLFLLSPRERKQVIFLLGMIIIMTFLDVIGVASILPFVSVLSDNSLIEKNHILQNMFKISDVFGIKTTQEFLFALGLIVFLILIFSLFFKALTTYIQIRFIKMREYSIGKRLVEGYLHQPYSWFLSNHSSDLGKNILSEVQFVIGGGLIPFIQLIANGLAVIAIVTLLIITDPKLALLGFLTLGGVYGIIFYFINKYLNRIGNDLIKNNQKRFGIVSEVFGAIKEVKFAGLEKVYIKLFSNSAKTFSRIEISAKILSQLPRFILEAIAFGGILLILLYLISQSGSFTGAIPIVSMYIFAGYRLIPALQQVYSSFVQLNFIGPSIDKIYDDLRSLKTLNINESQKVFFFNKRIDLKNVYYEYNGSSSKALKKINLIISAKSTVGLVGPTGSGKTTTADIISGILEVKKGTLKVDGQVITNKNLRSWQRCIGYVPQHIYLADASIAANIAFGVESIDINQKAVEKSAKIANLHNFVMDELPKQYQTTIGERGIRLSGGQRQRIGIARALYHEPQVLILDEATSALDNQTEKAVMEALENINKDITIILIAHRLNTVKKCDKIFLFDKGEIKDQGTYKELINSNKNFRINANS
jgi:ABC-type multidrug transport system fused ATPase/permease subunit